MNSSLDHVANLFEQKGGEFVTPPFVMAQKLKKIKVFVFDWDGVFNEGEKGGQNTSGFSEIDSMGTNMLRFTSWLNTGQQPISVIMTGANNQAAYDFATREHFPLVYFKVPNKQKALDHLCARFDVQPEEIAFFFDDILDVAVARKVGLRIFIRSTAKILFSTFVSNHKYADYNTAFSGGQHGVREACELIIGLMNEYDEVIQKRIEFDSDYQTYLTQRNQLSTAFYTMGNNDEVVEHSVQ